MIKLLVIDVDGTMTNGGIIYDSSGVESKIFNVKDGLAMVSWIRLGGEIAVITGRNSFVVEKRMGELGVNYLFQGIKDKTHVLEKIMDQMKITYKEVATIGDDMNDFAMLVKSNMSFAPKDSNPLILEAVTHPLNANGGEGAVAQMIEAILAHENRTNEYLDLWLSETEKKWIAQ